MIGGLTALVTCQVAARHGYTPILPLLVAILFAMVVCGVGV